jgi:hypothetical protein
MGIGALTLYSMKRRTEKPNLYIKDSLPFGFNAMTIPPLGIFVTRNQSGNDALLNHELVHWNQYARVGLIPYFFGYMVQRLRYGYDKMPMEQEARSNENAYCRENYTEAVRTGLSGTVYNPNFRR